MLRWFTRSVAVLTLVGFSMVAATAAHAGTWHDGVYRIQAHRPPSGPGLNPLYIGVGSASPRDHRIRLFGLADPASRPLVEWRIYEHGEGELTNNNQSEIRPCTSPTSFVRSCAPRRPACAPSANGSPEAGSTAVSWTCCRHVAGELLDAGRPRQDPTHRQQRRPHTTSHGSGLHRGAGQLLPGHQGCVVHPPGQPPAMEVLRRLGSALHRSAKFDNGTYRGG